MISIIIPTYNDFDFLPECLRSIERQKVDKEIIVIDDGSTDATEKRLKGIGVPVIYKKVNHQGQNSCCNEGFRLSKGQFIFFADADMVLEDTCLLAMLEKLKDNPDSDFAYSDFTWIDTLNRPVGSIKGETWNIERLRKANYISRCSLIRREAFLKSGGFDITFSRLGDWDLWLTMANLGMKGVHIPAVLFKAYLRPKGISAKQDYAKHEANIRSKHGLCQYWDFTGFPLRAFILDEKLQKKLGFTTLKEERFAVVLPLLNGKVLDIGCGHNELIHTYRAKGGRGIGVDVFPFEGVDEIVDTTKLPYADKEFDTVTIIASLNHIPIQKRSAVIYEAHRVLRNEGNLIITMINPLVGWFCHKLTWWDFDQKQRGINRKEESYGLTTKYVVDIVQRGGFHLVKKHNFVYGLNKLFIFKKI